jgi:hypothetical protein
MRNPNPIVHRGPCVRCGGEVALFERDAEDYLAAPYRGLEHIGACPPRKERIMSGLVTVDENTVVLTTDEFLAEQTELQRKGARIADGAITDGMAKTIAAWWMAPDTELSALVHVGQADAQDLLAEIERELSAIQKRQGWVAEDHELHTLAAWVRYTAESTDT